MNDISAIIVAKDNPPHLVDTISSIQNLADEIIVADIGLDSAVKSNLKKIRKVKMITVDKEVPYVELIRDELKKQAAYRYVFFLDPDEIVPETLTRQLLSVYREFDYIKIPRKNNIFGKWIRHSRWWPDYQVRLFKKESVTWPKLIHQQPALTGKGFTIEARENYALIHHHYANVDEFIEKAVRYAKSEARELTAQKTQFTLTDAFRKALSEFISRYFGDEGYKDGMHGLVLSVLQMFYYILVYIYYWELNKYQEENHVSIQNSLRSFFRDGLYSINYWQIHMNISSYKEKIKSKILNRLLK